MFSRDGMTEGFFKAASFVAAQIQDKLSKSPSPEQIEMNDPIQEKLVNIFIKRLKF